MAISQIDICNNALDLIGQGNHITDLSANTKEADLSRRLYDQVLARCLEKFDWSFCRKDEYITDDYLLPDVASLPWKYTYSIPDDVLRVLYLLPDGANSFSETVNAENHIRFSLRNYDDARVLVTDNQAPFYMQYQCLISDTALMPPTFVEAFEFLLASRFASSLVKGETGVKIAMQLQQTGISYLTYSAGLDAQQGAESIKPVSNRIVRSRRGDLFK